MDSKNNLNQYHRPKVSRSHVFFLLLTSIVFAAAGASGNPVSPRSQPIEGNRYFLRVSGCDDGGRAYVNGVHMVEVGFDEDSNWLDITADVAKAKSEIKFRSVNKTGAITYVFQIKRNDTVIYEQACGTVKVVGCENNRAFRVGVAREFTYTLDPRK